MFKETQNFSSQCPVRDLFLSTRIFIPKAVLKIKDTHKNSTVKVKHSILHICVLSIGRAVWLSMHRIACILIWKFSLFFQIDKIFYLFVCFVMMRKVHDVSVKFRFPCNWFWFFLFLFFLFTWFGTFTKPCVLHSSILFSGIYPK